MKGTEQEVRVQRPKFQSKGKKPPLCSAKREPESPLSKYRGFGVYSMNKTGGRRKTFITTAA